MAALAPLLVSCASLPAKAAPSASAVAAPATSPEEGAAKAQADASEVLAIVDALGRLGEKPLWPGFDPRHIPVEIFDGRRTYLFEHPAPPDGFSPLEGHSGAFVYEGRHASVRANTTTRLGGRDTATVGLAWMGSAVSPEARAAAILHEQFHVFQSTAHPDWGANEAELMVYPLDDAEALALRRLETRALVSALAATDRSERVRQAAAALEIRRLRFERLGEGAAGYERATERLEGLAALVEHRAAPGEEAAVRLDAGFDATAVRLRAYAVGLALGRLLDDLAPGWEAAFDGAASPVLDRTLAAALQGAAPAPWRSDLDAERARAREDVARLLAERRARAQAFEARPGWRVVVRVDAEAPLRPRGFDPMNLKRLGGGALLHPTWCRFANDRGQVEVRSVEARTLPAGDHPLLQGVRELSVTGLAHAPTVREENGAVVLEGGGVSATFRDASVERRDREILVTVGGNGR